MRARWLRRTGVGVHVLKLTSATKQHRGGRLRKGRSMRAGAAQTHVRPHASRPRAAVSATPEEKGAITAAAAPPAASIASATRGSGGHGGSLVGQAAPDDAELLVAEFLHGGAHGRVAARPLADTPARRWACGPARGQHTVATRPAPRPRPRAAHMVQPTRPLHGARCAHQHPAGAWSTHGQARARTARPTSPCARPAHHTPHHTTHYTAHRLAHHTPHTSQRPTANVRYGCDVREHPGVVGPAEGEQRHPDVHHRTLQVSARRRHTASATPARRQLVVST